MGVVIGPGSACVSAKILASRQPARGRSRRFARKNPSNSWIAQEIERTVFWPVGQILTGQRRPVTAICALALTSALIGACGGNSSIGKGSVSQEAVASVRNEPKGFTRHAR